MRPSFAIAIVLTAAISPALSFPLNVHKGRHGYGPSHLHSRQQQVAGEVSDQSGASFGSEFLQGFESVFKAIGLRDEMQARELGSLTARQVAGNLNDQSGASFGSEFLQGFESVFKAIGLRDEMQARELGSLTTRQVVGNPNDQSGASFGSDFLQGFESVFKAIGLRDIITAHDLVQEHLARRGVSLEPPTTIRFPASNTWLMEPELRELVARAMLADANSLDALD